MTIKALQFSYNGESHQTPPTENISINIDLDNGEFVTQQSIYTLTVFYGLPPRYSGNYPVTSYYLYPQKLQFTQNINSFYSVANIKTYGESIIGTVSTPEPLPFSLTITPLDGGPSTTLEPGQLSVKFNIPISGVSASEADAVIASKLSIING